jgi:hypothetical protein
MQRLEDAEGGTSVGALRGPRPSRLVQPVSTGSRSADRGGMTCAMPDPSSRQRPKTPAGAEKDFVTRLADAGEDALQRLAELAGGQRALNAFNDLRVRVDDVAKKVRGIDALEARLAKLEKEVGALKKAKTPARRPSSRKPAA